MPAGGVSGRELLAEIEREGVPVHHVDAHADTRLYITVWEELTHRQFRILVEGEPLAEPVWRACVNAVDGSLQPEFVVAELADRSRRAGARFVCDSSGHALRAALDARADLIKPSRRELRDLIAPGAP